MKPKQREQALLFLRKAAEDEALLDAVLNAPSVADSSIGFHCQQAAEKLLKALLSQKEIRFQKTHDLRELMTLLEKAGSPLPESMSRVDEWTPYAVEWRYDYLMEGESFNRNEARDLIRKLRLFVESQINPRLNNA